MLQFYLRELRIHGSPLTADSEVAIGAARVLLLAENQRKATSSKERYSPEIFAAKKRFLSEVVLVSPSRIVLHSHFFVGSSSRSSKTPSVFFHFIS